MSVSLKIVIPKATGTTSTQRKPAYVDSNTQSMTLTLLQVNGVAVTGAAVQGPFNLTATSPGCTSGSSGLTCTYSINAPVGTDIFVANTYSATNAAGNPLGSGSVALKIASNGQNVASLTLQGPVASVELFSDATNIWNAQGGGPLQLESRGKNPLSATGPARTTAGTTRTTAAATRSPAGSVNPGSSSRLFVVALDVNGAQIINPTTFDIPLTLTLSLNPMYLPGLPAGVASITDTYLYPNGGPASSTTSADGGTVVVTSPGDTITYATTNTVFGQGFTAIGLTYTPQAGPNAGVAQTVAPITYGVNAPLYLGLTATHIDPLTVGVQGNLTLTVSNPGAGPTSGALTVTDAFDPSLTFVPSGSTAGCVLSSPGYVTCTSNATIAAGGSQVFTIAVTPTTTLSTSSASAAVSGGGTTSGTNAFDTINVTNPVPIMTATHTPSSGLTDNNWSVHQGSAGTFTISNVTNAGPVTTTSAVVVVDTLPAGFTGSGAGPGWNCSNTSPSVIQCTSVVTTLAGGASIPGSITITAGPPTVAGPGTNSITVNAGGATQVNYSDSVLVYGPITATVLDPFSSIAGGGGYLKMTVGSNAYVQVSEPYYTGLWYGTISGAGCASDMTTTAGNPNVTVTPNTPVGAGVCTVQIKDVDGLSPGAPWPEQATVTSIGLTGS